MNWRTAKQLTYATFTILYGWMVLAFVARLMMPGAPGTEQFFQTFKPIIAVLIGFQGLLSVPFVWLCKAVTQFLPDLVNILPFTTPDKLYDSSLFLLRLIPYFHGVGGAGVLDKITFATTLPGYIDWTIPMVIVLLAKIEGVIHATVNEKMSLSDYQEQVADQKQMRRSILSDYQPDASDSKVSKTITPKKQDKLESISGTEVEPIQHLSKRPGKVVADLRPSTPEPVPPSQTIAKGFDVASGFKDQTFLMQELPLLMEGSLRNGHYLGLLWITFDQWEQAQIGPLSQRLQAIQPVEGELHFYRIAPETVLVVFQNIPLDPAKQSALQILQAIRSVNTEEQTMLASLGLFNVHYLPHNGSHGLSLNQFMEQAKAQADKSKQNGGNRISLGVIE